MKRIGIDVRKLKDYGIGTYLRELLARFPGLNPQYNYLLYCSPQDNAAPQIQHAQYHLVNTTAPPYSIRELVTLARRIRQDQLALYHSPHYVLPPHRKCPTVVTIHDVIHLTASNYRDKLLTRWYAWLMMRYAVRSSQAIITVSQSAKAEIIRRLKVPEEKITVILNGVCGKFKPQPPGFARQSVKEDLGIAKPYLLYVGNLLPHKNLPRLLKAFAELKKQGGEYGELLLVIRGGSRERQAELATLSETLGVEGHIKFLGNVTTELLVTLYNGCQGFIFPSLIEGFGLPPLEALACGAPVAVSRIPSLTELLADTGLYFAPEDYLDIANAMRRLLTDASWREKLRTVGPQRAKAFSWERAASETLTLYEAVIGGQS